MGATNDLLIGFKDVCEARADYLRAQKFYDGEIGELFGSTKAAQLAKKIGVHSIEDFNFAAIAVDAPIDKMRITKISATTDNGKEAAAAMEIIDRVWKKNSMDIESNTVHRKMGEYGDSLLCAWPTFNDEDETSVLGVDLWYESPLNARVIYDPDFPTQALFGIKAWDGHDSAKKEINYATLYYKDHIEYWQTNPGGDPKKAESWYKRQEDKENRYGRIPMFHFRTGTVYGRPLHKRAYGPQTIINKIIGTYAAGIDYTTFPQRYVLMDPKADDVLNNNFEFSPEDDEDDPEGDGSSGLRADPASIWKLRGMKGVGQFDTADPDTLLKPMDRCVKSIAQLTQTPFHYFDPSGDVPSGESLKTANEPLYNKVEDLEALAEASWVDVLEFVLLIFGIEDITVDVKWKPIRTVSDGEGWDVLKKKRENGVPMEQTLTEAGYTNEQVEGWMADGADMQSKLQMLSVMADVADKLGNAVAMGIMDEGLVKQMMAKMMGQAEPDTVEDEDPEDMPENMPPNEE